MPAGTFYSMTLMNACTEVQNTSLLGGQFCWPRRGKHNDKAHPPIHPTKAADRAFNAEERKVYEYITRRFLACCSQNAKGANITANIAVGDELFDIVGLRVTERNYLDVYPYDTWKSNEIPMLSPGMHLTIVSLRVDSGQTSRPNVLTEAELITAMDKNGIGLTFVFIIQWR